MKEDSKSTILTEFILHWGSMGAPWGVNRTIAQIHALLYLSPEPLPAERIADELSIARSNVSNSLRELLSWGIVRKGAMRGDRRDHFESLDDVWEMFRVVLDERKRREFDPTLAVLSRSVEELRAAGAAEAHETGKLAEMLEFFEAATALHEEMRRLPTGALRRLMKMGQAVRKLVEPKRRS
jgi:DNA-binding transcriptional regulator GbsR (MarR family)